MTPGVTRVLVIASSAIVRAGLETLLREDSRFAVASASSTRVHETPPDVLLMEIASADKLWRHPSLASADALPTVLLADHLGRAELRRTLHSGVRAVLPRDATAPEIVAAIVAAAAGLTVLSADDVDTLLPAASEAIVADSIPGESLSSRELEVLAMMAEGAGNKDIGSRLKITEHTVKFHVSSIIAKLRVTTRGEAVARGVREGLIVI
jgi:DNA-binding NarL/FixJ family response regulator